MKIIITIESKLTPFHQKTFFSGVVASLLALKRFYNDKSVKKLEITIDDGISEKSIQQVYEDLEK